MRSHEHRTIGDAATGGAAVPVGSTGVSLSYGDIVALTGDYFPPRGDDSLFAQSSIDEVLCALQVAASDEVTPDPRFGPDGPFASRRLDTRGGQSDIERRVRDRYLALAATNDDHFVAPGHAGVTTASGTPSSTAAYRRFHRRALDEAWQAGLDGGDLAGAMAREAAAQHYLTDSFAAGHLRTPVADVRRYWKARYPDFWNQLQRTVSSQTAAALRDVSGLLRAVPARSLERRTAIELARRTSTFPDLSLGDLVARVFHDWDNAHGLVVEGGAVVFGDGRVEDGHTTALCLAAVRAGIDDVDAAYQLGHSGHAVGGHALYAAVREATGAGNRFRAEALVPVVSPDNPCPNWRMASAAELWDAPIVGSGGTTVGQALEEMLAPGGAFIRQLDALGRGLAGGGGMFALPLVGTWLAGRCCTAFHQGFVEPLSAHPGDALRALLPNDDPEPYEHPVAAAS